MERVLVIEDEIAMRRGLEDVLWSLLNTKANMASRPVRDELAVVLRDTAGGRNLIGIGLDQDIVDCAQIDRYDVVPELDLQAWRITAR